MGSRKEKFSAIRRMSVQIVTDDTQKWDQAIMDAQTLLKKVQARAARLKGAIETFTELRDCGHPFDGSGSVAKMDI